VRARAERRGFRRVGPQDCPGASGLRIRPGRGAQVIDLSGGGLLIESDAQVLPGAFLDVLLRTGDTARVMRARVTRCSVSSLHPVDGIRYRAGICFQQPVREFVGGLGSWEGNTQLPIRGPADE
jgi:hypothetical protein